MRINAPRLISLLVMVFGALPVSAAPTNRYVSTSGASTVPYDTWAKAGTNPKTVVDYANTFNEGDTVWISNGTYTLTAAIAVGNTIVKSFNTNVAGTVINGNGATRCLAIGNTGAWVEGLTISNGYVSADSGGGVVISGGILTNCVVRNCVALYAGDYGGGGVYFWYNGGGTIANCAIISNRQNGAQFAGGGGVFINGSQGILRNCTIAGNTANIGGGICQRSTSSGALIDNCDIFNNISTNNSAGGYEGGGGGIYTPTSALVVTNCRIYGNTAMEAGGGIFVSHAGSQKYPLFRNCSIFSNVANCGVLSVFLNNDYGGGGGIFAGGGIYSDCTISGNVSSNTGGGIHCYRWASVLSNCVIRGNTANIGAGFYAIYNYDSGARIDINNCLIAENVATNTGGGMALNPYSGGYANPITFRNCTIVSNTALGAGSVGGIKIYNGFAAFTNYFMNGIIYFNSGVTYSNWGPTTYSQYLCFSNSCTAPTNGTYFTGTNNIASNPLLVGKDENNYQLAKGSPCINTGTNEAWMNIAVDLGGHVRIVNGTVDMGAYEWFPRGTIIMVQ